MIISLFLIVGVALLLGSAPQLIVSLNRYRLKKYTYDKLREKDMPTVSVCIPARNETHALAECLEAVLTSDYPKLEVIVLDDCSQDKTSEVIKSFAHDGVRFVKGSQPAEGWLGRNYASEVLTREASGSFIFFLSVDTLVSPTSISQCVSYALLKHASMVSILPRRKDNGFRPSVFLSTLRYFFPMVIPQFLHTPVSPAAWMVSRKALQEIGGFESQSGTIMPESYFARTFDEHGAYRYIISDDTLGIYHAKRWRSQIDTSIRLAYPSLFKSPLYVLVAVLILYTGLVIPYVLAITSIISWRWDLPSFVAVVLCLSYFVLYIFYTRRVWRHGWLLGAFVFPYIVLQEIALIISSMVAYASGRVDWKGRNICYPVLHRPKKSS